MEGLIAEQLKVSGMDIIEKGLSTDDISALKVADPDFYTNEDSVIDMDRYVAVNNYLGNHLTSLDRIAVLNMLAESLPEGSVHLFTRSDTSELDKRIVVHGGVNTLTEMPAVFRASKINLNLTSRTIRCGLPQRIWDIVGCRAFCLTNAVPAMDGLLDEGRDIVTFSSYEELPDICMHYLDRDDEREEIAISGFNKTAASHTVLLRALEIVRMILAEKLSQ
jgi:spore maturation protein CgeB